MVIADDPFFRETEREFLSEASVGLAEASSRSRAIHIISRRRTTPARVANRGAPLTPPARVPLPPPPPARGGAGDEPPTARACARAVIGEGCARRFAGDPNSGGVSDLNYLATRVRSWLQVGEEHLAFIPVFGSDPVTRNRLYRVDCGCALD